jgi:hypothetical protein
MTLPDKTRAALACGLIMALSSCGGFDSLRGSSGLFGNRNSGTVPSADTLERRAAADAQRAAQEAALGEERESTIWDLFRNSSDPNTTVEVNKYLWVAAQDVLNFLPIESVDPFTGVIVTGYGVPPGGGQSYRATIYVQDPALDARSLRVSLQTRGGAPVSRETARAIEDAILTRARQLRIQDSKL